MTKRNKSNHAPVLRRRKFSAFVVSALLLPPALRAQERARRPEVNIRDYGEAPNGDWTGLLHAACMEAQRVLFPAGTYLINEGRFPANTELRGEGERSVLRMASGARWLLASWPQGGGQVQGLRLSQLQLRGNCDTEGFSEHVHLLRLSGVADVHIENALLRGFRGDGIYLGQAKAAGEAIHNRRIVIRACHFDGINGQNRQGISVIDGDDIVIENSLFERCTRRDMPGAIDFEPNDGSAVVRNVIVRGNRFRQVGGGVGVIAFHLPGEMQVPASDIQVSGNHASAYRGSGAFLYFNPNRPANESAPACRLLAEGNEAREGERPINISGRQIELRNNRFTDFRSSGHIGDPTNGGMRDLTMRNNVFLRCGSVSGNGLSVFSVDGLLMEGNRFIDCGSGRRGAANAIDFNRGRSSRVVLKGNVFSSPTGRTQVAIQREAAHVSAPETNRLQGNDFGGLRNYWGQVLHLHD